MKKPLSAGDICEVIGGFQKKSPNLGMRVTIVSRTYGAGGSDHWEHGSIWRCSGQGIKLLQTDGTMVVSDWADFASDWLRRIDDAPKATDTTTKKELSV